MIELHPNLKSRDLGLDRHCHVPVRSDSDPRLALDVVDRWILDCLDEMQKLPDGECGRKHFRLFYHDRIFTELMFRLIVQKQAVGRISRQLVLARIAVRPLHREKGYFRRLLQGLQQLAERVDASFEIEAANSNLSRILFYLGYLRCDDKDGEGAKIRTDLSGSWKYNPGRASGMALIELPADVLAITRRGKGISFDTHDRMSALLNTEVARFVARVAKRMEVEFGSITQKNGRI